MTPTSVSNVLTLFSSSGSLKDVKQTRQAQPFAQVKHAFFSLSLSLSLFLTHTHMLVRKDALHVNTNLIYFDHPNMLCTPRLVHLSAAIVKSVTFLHLCAVFLRLQIFSHACALFRIRARNCNRSGHPYHTREITSSFFSQ